jgi:hypothetical protein
VSDSPSASASSSSSVSASSSASPSAVSQSTSPSASASSSESSSTSASSSASPSAVSQSTSPSASESASSSGAPSESTSASVEPSDSPSSSASASAESPSESSSNSASVSPSASSSESSSISSAPSESTSASVEPSDSPSSSASTSAQLPSESSSYSASSSASPSPSLSKSGTPSASVSPSPILIEPLYETARALYTDTEWKLITLTEPFNSPIPVCTSYFAQINNPVVPRVRNVAFDSFELTVRSLRPDETLTAPVEIDCVIFERGVYTEAANGINMEVRRTPSMDTSTPSTWIESQLVLANTYTDPIVLGQVQTENNPIYSSFYSLGYNSSSNSVNFGKWTRVLFGTPFELVGIVVMESSSSGIWRGRPYQAIKGTAAKGTTYLPPNEYPVDFTPVAGTNSMASMNAPQGGISVFHGRPSAAFANDAAALSVYRSVRVTTTETVDALVFGDYI